MYILCMTLHLFHLKQNLNYVYETDAISYFYSDITANFLSKSRLVLCQFTMTDDYFFPNYVK